MCYYYSGTDAENYGDIEKILLIPNEFFKNMQSISVSCYESKWYDFEVTEEEELKTSLTILYRQVECDKKNPHLSVWVYVIKWTY